MIYRTIKGVADKILYAVSRSLPAWQTDEIEQIFPAPASYQPIAPVNLSMFSAAVVERFTAPVSLPAHRLFRLRNVYATWDGAVFCNLRLFVPSIVHEQFAARFQDTLLLRQWVGEKVTQRSGSIAICHNQWSAENYYHWLVDTLPRLLILRQKYPHIRLLLPRPPRQLPDYICRSAEIMGFSDHLFIQPRQILRAGCVILPELTAPSLTHNPALILQVREELLAALRPEPRRADRKIYAARSAQGVRRILNELALDQLMLEAGFEKVYFEQLSFLEQVQLMSETSLLLGIHGAGMANMLFLPCGAKIIELLNEEHGDRCYFRLASCLGLPYFLAPCVGVNQELANQSDMVIEIPLLKQVLEAASIGVAI